MTGCGTSTLTVASIEGTIRSLLPHVAVEARPRLRRTWLEYDLRRELVACILGSQVRQEMAVAYTERLENEGLLDDGWWRHGGDDGFALLIRDALQRRTGASRVGRYRFPKARAAQVTRARDSLVRRSLCSRLKEDGPPKDLRRRMIADISGLGPKQASMFLRNVGVSYDLAVLDVHVLRFMKMRGLLSEEGVRVGTLARYERVEEIATAYAGSWGYPVGFIDVAVWATMKAARELRL